jgi:hypothetical protein
MKTLLKNLTTFLVLGLVAGAVWLAVRAVAVDPGAPAELVRAHIDGCAVCSDPARPRASCPQLMRLSAALYPAETARPVLPPAPEPDEAQFPPPLSAAPAAH